MQMARVLPATRTLHPDAQAELDRQVADHGRVTNMKRTLAHSPVALHALMTWYPLREEVAAFLGDRATLLFAHAVSTETDCLICSTFFRRILIEQSENPDELHLNDTEQAVVHYGQAIARNRHVVPDDVFAALRNLFTDQQIVSLTAFAALMIATNAFNNALEVELDEYLQAFRKPTAQSKVS
jgi:alkylhydroperoxidase family enzyme